MVNGQGVAWNERKARAYGRGASALAPGVVKGLKEVYHPVLVMNTNIFK